jgi:imidazole glycerol-phosphate synthase subunit HisH
MRRSRIAIVDYQLSNLFSVKNAIDSLGFESQVVTEPSEILEADGLILPGVGAFPEAMRRLDSLGFIVAIEKFVLSGRPLLGICLGLHLLFSTSEEYGVHEGLGLINGDVLALKNRVRSVAIPHVGWNTTERTVVHSAPSGGALAGLDIVDGGYYYFVHSYAVEPSNVADKFTTTTYGGYQFCSSIVKDNIFGCQFHPEKSGTAGLNIFNSVFG